MNKALYGMTKKATTHVRLHFYSKQNEELSREKRRKAERALKQFEQGNPRGVIQILEEDLKNLIPESSPHHARLTTCVLLMRKHLQQ